MKRYEDVTRASLTPRMPAVIRLDGKAFHTLTRGIKKPWDPSFSRCMWNTAQYLCEQIQGCRLAYVQSDEISLLLVDYEELNSQAWFSGDLRKIVSVSASMASSYFSQQWNNGFPVFDSRVWNVPREDVVNYFVWRQQDAARNSIQALAQAHYSHKELHGKSCVALVADLEEKKGIVWGNCPTAQKRGVCVVREFTPGSPTPRTDGADLGTSFRNELPIAARWDWRLDTEPPTFRENREYIERYVYPERGKVAA